MNLKVTSILIGVAAVSAANAVTFAPGIGSPTLSTAGSSQSYTASQVYATGPGLFRYVVKIPTNFLTTNGTGNLNWDFYATADPGKKIVAVKIYMDMYTVGSPSPVYAHGTTNAKYVLPGGSEVAVPTITTPNLPTSLPNRLTYALPGLHDKWHISTVSTVSVAAGTIHISEAYAEVTEAVPEPGTFAALGLGGLALVARRRRRA